MRILNQKLKIVIAAVLAGIFALMIVKWIIRNQHNWKHKIIKED